MDYRKEIDGLRALAVVPVILFHAGFEVFSGGFIGVDVFFVISGYLITSIILKDLERGSFSILDFYERRARRILPALFWMLLVCLPMAWLWLLPGDAKEFSQSLLATSLFASNLFFWQQSGYFHTAAELKPLLHTWSLAVEEQYYVILPLFMLSFWRYGKRWIVSVLAIIAAISMVLAEAGSRTHPDAAFYLVPTRGWELLMGALAAFCLSQRERHPMSPGIKEGAGWLGIAMIVTAILIYNKTTRFPGIYALLPTVGTLLIILFATQQTRSGRFLGNKAFVGIGLCSYSAYLWHQPLFVFARHAEAVEPSKLVFSGLALLSMLLGWASWRFIETPFRNRERLTRRSLGIFSFTGLIIFACIGGTGSALNKTYEEYWLTRFPETQQAFYRNIINTSQGAQNFSAAENGKQNFAPCRFNASELDSKTEKTLLECHATHGPGLLVLGDSHAIDLFGVVSSRFDNAFIVGLTSGGCRPHTPHRDCQYAAAKAFVQSHPETFKHILYEQAGFYLMRDARGNEGTRTMFTKIPHDQAVPISGYDQKKIQATLDYLVELARVTPVTWLLPRLEPHISRRFFVQQGCHYRYGLRLNLTDIFDGLEQEINSVAAAHPTPPNFRLLSQNHLMKFVLPDDLANCDAIYWSDGDHLSSAGEIRFGQRLPPDFLNPPNSTH